LGMNEMYSVSLDIYGGGGKPVQDRYKMVVGIGDYQKYRFDSSLKNKTSITLYKNCVGPPKDEYSFENFYKSNLGIRQALIAYLSMIFFLFVALTGLCILDRKIQADRNKIEISMIDPIDSVTL
jgi:hypothetical protein